MKTSASRVRISAIAALNVLTFVVMATIILPPSGVVEAQETGLIPFPPRHFPILPGVGAEPGPAVPPPVSQPPAGAPSVKSGTWTPLSNQPSIYPFYPGSVFLLTDGTVLAQDDDLTTIGWWKLTPDNTGSYINGAWSQVASPPDCYNGYVDEDLVYSPLYYASAVLPDGRFVIIGGEYDYNYNYLNEGGAVWTDQGAIYDSVANTWTCIVAPKGWKQIGDAESVVLPDGTFMLADPFSNEVATLNVKTNPPTFNNPFTPTGKSADPYNDEEGWNLLPSGEVLTL